MFVRLPSQEIVTTTSSPGFRNTFGSRAKPTPPGVPVAITSPGFKVIRELHVLDQPRHRVDHQRGGGRLHDLAVHFRGQLEHLRVRNLVAGHRGGTAGTGGVERLPHQPLRAVQLQVAGRDVVQRHVAGDVVERVRLGHVAAGAADHHGELTLPVDPLRRDSGEHHRALVADQGGVELREDHGVRLRPQCLVLFLGLFDVVAIVEADAEDLFGVRDEAAQGQLRARPATVGRQLPSGARQRVERGLVGGSHDRLHRAPLDSAVETRSRGALRSRDDQIPVDEQAGAELTFLTHVTD